MHVRALGLGTRLRAPVCMPVQVTAITQENVKKVAARGDNLNDLQERAGE